jgi:hypothetical protein
VGHRRDDRRLPRLRHRPHPGRQCRAAEGAGHLGAVQGPGQSDLDRTGHRRVAGAETVLARPHLAPPSVRYRAPRDRLRRAIFDPSGRRLPGRARAGPGPAAQGLQRTDEAARIPGRRRPHQQAAHRQRVRRTPRDLHQRHPLGPMAGTGDRIRGQAFRQGDREAGNRRSGEPDPRVSDRRRARNRFAVPHRQQIRERPHPAGAL